MITEFEEYYEKKQKRKAERIYKDFGDYFRKVKVSWGLKEGIGIHKVPFFDPDDVRAGFECWIKSSEAEEISNEFLAKQRIHSDLDMMDYYEEVVVPSIIDQQVKEYRAKKQRLYRAKYTSNCKKIKMLKESTHVKS